MSTKDLDNNAKKKKFTPNYLAGMASMGASSICHPLDTVKVRLQTQSKVKARLGSFAMTGSILNTTGFLSLYSGLSAALLRQATYSTTRFSVYESFKEILLKRRAQKNLQGDLPFYQKTPNDLVCVRMQNDTQLPPNQRRNYKNVFEAFYRIAKTEGFPRLYVGFSMATFRGVLVTIGQLAFYDEFKTRLMNSKYFDDNMITHITASMGAGLIATLITMPADVIKTLLMNAKPGEFRGIMHCGTDLLKRDRIGLFRGFWPRYIRLGPFTILTFVFYEKLKIFSNNFVFAS